MTLRQIIRARVALIGLAALALAACSGMPGGAPGLGQAAAPERSATIARGVLLSTVNATGNIQAESETRLAFQQPGKVAEVNVEVGSQVKKGDVIARLDTTDLDLALKQARASLVIANASYSRTVEGGRDTDIAAAQAALNAAYAGYNQLKQGADQADIAAANAALRKAEAELRQAQSAYDIAFKIKPSAIGDSPTVAQLQQAKNNLQAAQAQLQNVMQGADNAQLAATVQQIEDAKARLEKLQAPAQDFDIRRAEAERKRAELAVEQARRRLAKAVLVAPADGLVSAVAIDAGEMAGAQPVVTLVDTSVFHIDVKVDEIDIARVREGQEVQVTLDALSGVEVNGSIERIAPTSALANGIVSYAVRIVLDQTDAPLRAGMTANASIILDRRDGALLAPNWAVRRDRASGATYLTVRQADGKLQEVEVQTGLRSDTLTEILSGVGEGQVVVSPQASAQ
jgi:HlyD family secretion protein